MRVAGSTLLVAWAAETGLKEAAVHKRLESATYRRLSLGCAIKSLLYIGAFFYSSRLWCPALIVIYPSLACLSYMVNHWTLLSNQFIATQKQMKEPNGNFDIMAIYFSLKEFLPRFKPSPSAPPSAQKEASVYCIISIVYFVVAIGCYLFPLDLIHANLPPRPTDEVLGRILQDRQSFIAATCTPGFILASAACQVLMDAAERGRLNGGTFRRLNLGLGLMEVLLAFTLVSSSVFPGPVEATMGLGIHLIASLFAAFFFISNFFKYPAKT